MSSENYETNSYRHNLDFANHLALIACSRPTGSGCREKSIQITHIYLSTRLFVLQLKKENSNNCVVLSRLESLTRKWFVFNLHKSSLALTPFCTISFTEPFRKVEVIPGRWLNQDPCWSQRWPWSPSCLPDVVLHPIFPQQYTILVQLFFQFGQPVTQRFMSFKPYKCKNTSSS